MKKVFVRILLFYLILHFILPCFYYLARGFVNEYNNFYDLEALIKGFLLNFITITGTIIAIQFLPDKKQQIEPLFDHTTKFYTIAALLVIIPFIIYGGYKGALIGAGNSTTYSYLRLFFDFSTALLVTLFFQKKTINIFYLLIIYIFILTFSGSRSAVIFIFLLFLMFPMFSNSNLYMKIILKYLKIVLIISPFLFIIGTSKRVQHTNPKLQKLDYVTARIIGRISFLELNMIAIGKADNNSANMELFNEKYGISNQLKQVANTISPHDFFKYDVDPNQYFRSVFFGLPVKNARNSYMSINLTLPVYFYLKVGFFFSCIISILLLSFLYLIWINFSKNLYILVLVLMSLYQILYFFDWVMIFKGIFSVVLTIFMLYKFEFIARIISRTFKIPINIRFKKVVVRFKKVKV